MNNLTLKTEKTPLQFKTSFITNTLLKKYKLLKKMNDLNISSSKVRINNGNYNINILNLIETSKDNLNKNKISLTKIAKSRNNNALKNFIKDENSSEKLLHFSNKLNKYQEDSKILCSNLDFTTKNLNWSNSKSPNMTQKSKNSNKSVSNKNEKLLEKNNNYFKNKTIESPNNKIEDSILFQKNKKNNKNFPIKTYLSKVDFSPKSLEKYSHNFYFISKKSNKKLLKNNNNKLSLNNLNKTINYFSSSSTRCAKISSETKNKEKMFETIFENKFDKTSKNNNINYKKNEIIDSSSIKKNKRLENDKQTLICKSSSKKINENNIRLQLIKEYRDKLILENEIFRKNKTVYFCRERKIKDNANQKSKLFNNEFNILYSENNSEFNSNFKKHISKKSIKGLCLSHTNDCPEAIQNEVQNLATLSKDKLDVVKSIVDYTFPKIILKHIDKRRKSKKVFNTTVQTKTEMLNKKEKEQKLKYNYFSKSIQIINTKNRNLYYKKSNKE